MPRWVKVMLVPMLLALSWTAFVVHARLTFPKDTLPEGAYARIALAVTENRLHDAFAYLETPAQWACHSVREYRAKAADLVSQNYPEQQKALLLAPHQHEAQAADGADVWAWLAYSRGWVDRLRRDLSGAKKIEVAGERATVETARGTRYAFRRRENGIWGLTAFTAELMAEAEKAARDYELIRRAAADYARADSFAQPRQD